jgi:putative tryptophan/tyrosine transport system substrate-binding protein
MRRREFIAGLGSAAAWPLVVRAQQSAIPVVGYFYAGSPEPFANQVAAFRKGLSETGYVEGRNLTIEYRFARDEVNRLPELAAALVRLRVAVIATPASSLAALAAKAATATIPIVFTTGGDPVQAGIVASLNRPGGNITGITSMNTELGAKRLQLLHELLPGAARFAVLVGPTSPITDPMIAGLQAAASTIGGSIEVFHASTNRDIDTIFASLVQKRVDALMVSPGALLDNRRVQLVSLAAYYRLPTIYPFRENAEIGGLMSYGTSAADRDRQAGIYTGRILKGEKPADLPVMRAIKFEFVINLQTAKLLGLTIPETLLATADEVIQ